MTAQPCSMFEFLSSCVGRGAPVLLPPPPPPPVPADEGRQENKGKGRGKGRGRPRGQKRILQEQDNAMVTKLFRARDETNGRASFGSFMSAAYSYFALPMCSRYFFMRTMYRYIWPFPVCLLKPEPKPYTNRLPATPRLITRDSFGGDSRNQGLASVSKISKDLLVDSM